jgi:trehalose 6-phosphate phosphatase
MGEPLDFLNEDPSHTGIFVDFDGTISPIVDRPEDALPAEGAIDVLLALAEKFALVAVLSGRPTDFLKSRFPRSPILLAGAYGRDRSDRSGRRMTEGWEPVAAAAVVATSKLEGVLIERKGAGVALHYRLAPEHEAAANEIAVALAKEFELEVLPGRLVAELVVPGPKKGDALRDLVAERELRSVLVAGDDLADVEAFDVVRQLDVRAVCVAVASEEAPQRLVEGSDITVDRPEELVALLGKLV